ncbi:ATP-binding protein [Streptomyces sp. NPDC059568]|uniref:ATP-binding protein n=1 Tax=Streptomyces sp. NPDC059568 TaxID=3346868 RepID=UPI0036A3ECCD
MTVTAIPHPAGRPGYSETLPCEPRSAAVARRLVRTALGAWGHEGLADDGALIVTELVANATEHSGSRLIRVVISRSPEGFVRLGVVDRSRIIPVIRTDSNGDQTRGRGLLMVDALTDRWGTDLYRWGKQVWGELKCEVRP